MTDTFNAKGFSIGIKLSLSPTIRREWQTRCIADAVPALDGYAGEAAVMVDHATALEIAKDCDWYADPKAVDATPGERSAYRTSGKQIREAM